MVNASNKGSLILNNVSFIVYFDLIESKIILIINIIPNVKTETSKKLLITEIVLIFIAESCSANNPSNPNGKRYLSQVMSV